MKSRQSKDFGSEPKSASRAWRGTWFPESSAARAGIRVGDIIVAIDGVPVGQPEEVESWAGQWEILRSDGTRAMMSVAADSIVDPIEPSIVSPEVLRVPTFLPEGFSDAQLTALAQGIAHLERLVIDLRGNPGGSFPATMAMNTTTIDGSRIGRLPDAPSSGSSLALSVCGRAQRGISLLTVI